MSIPAHVELDQAILTLATATQSSTPTERFDEVTVSVGGQPSKADPRTDFIMTYDVPGLNHEDIKIIVQASRLIICGESHGAQAKQGTFAKTLPIPAGITATDITANLEGSTLIISFPKVPIP